jgi:hypothetical protein
MRSNTRQTPATRSSTRKKGWKGYTIVRDEDDVEEEKLPNLKPDIFTTEQGEDESDEAETGARKRKGDDDSAEEIEDSDETNKRRRRRKKTQPPSRFVFIRMILIVAYLNLACMSDHPFFFPLRSFSKPPSKRGATSFIYEHNSYRHESYDYDDYDLDDFVVEADEDECEDDEDQIEVQSDSSEERRKRRRDRHPRRSPKVDVDDDDELFGAQSIEGEEAKAQQPIPHSSNRKLNARIIMSDDDDEDGNTLETKTPVIHRLKRKSEVLENNVKPALESTDQLVTNVDEDDDDTFEDSFTLSMKGKIASGSSSYISPKSAPAIANVGDLSMDLASALFGEELKESQKPASTQSSASKRIIIDDDSDESPLPKKGAISSLKMALTDDDSDSPLLSLIPSTHPTRRTKSVIILDDDEGTGAEPIATTSRASKPSASAESLAIKGKSPIAARNKEPSVLSSPFTTPTKTKVSSEITIPFNFNSPEDVVMNQAKSEPGPITPTTRRSSRISSIESKKRNRKDETKDLLSTPTSHRTDLKIIAEFINSDEEEDDDDDDDDNQFEFGPLKLESRKSQPVSLRESRSGHLDASLSDEEDEDLEAEHDDIEAFVVSDSEDVKSETKIDCVCKKNGGVLSYEGVKLRCCRRQCRKWVHGECFGVKSSKKRIQGFVCHTCKPRQVRSRMRTRSIWILTLVLFLGSISRRKQLYQCNDT